MLRELFNAVTYRNAYTNPDPESGLEIVYGPRGQRTVHDPRVPAYLDARRRRIIRDGLDPLDRLLLDPATERLLRQTADQMRAAEFVRPAYLAPPPPRRELRQVA